MSITYEITVCYCGIGGCLIRTYLNQIQLYPEIDVRPTCKNNDLNKY